MSITEVLPILRDLDHHDKVQALEFLASELDREKLAQVTPGMVYEVWSPDASMETVQAMLAAKEEAEAEAAQNEN